MNETIDNQLTVKAANGQDVTISVLDIIDSIEFNKSFMIYSVDGDDGVFASVLDETDTTFALNAITDKMEWDYINAQIDMTLKEEE
jgi:hypothetical protein